ncbi:F-box-like protein [Ceratobasidium sp. AG-Ba]|nr:F-box-like protein [Ceratobasidium sp. AG-Ba]
MSASSIERPHSFNQGRNIRTALDMWKEGRVKLLRSIEHYRDTCNTLDVACRAALGQPEDLGDLENALATIGSELGPLETYEDILCKERMRLATMRNTSGALVRINLLPPEVLAHVFKLSNTCYIEGNTVRLCELASVCTRWRWIALSMPELWTHIDIGLRTPNGLTQLFLQNSRNSAICIHLDEQYSKPYDRRGKPYEGVDNYDSAVHQLVQTLTPHIHRVHTLDITATNQEFAMKVAQIWLDFGNPGLSNTLSIRLPEDGGFITIGDSEGDGIGFEHPENALRALRSIKVLHVQCARFSWDSPAYHQLTDLRVCNDDNAVIFKPCELFGILNSSPNLEVLKLEGINMLRIRGWTQPIPIIFNHLRTLKVSRCAQGSLDILLSMVTVACECAVGIETVDLGHGGIAGFFSRSRTVVLSLDCSRDDGLTYVVSFLDGLPPLRTIILDDLYTTLPAQHQPQILPTDRRTSMIIVNSTVDLEGLRYIVSVLGVRSLRLECCRVMDSWPTTTLERIRTSLVKTYPELECLITDTESTKYLACRIMFEGDVI